MFSKSITLTYKVKLVGDPYTYEIEHSTEFDTDDLLSFLEMDYTNPDDREVIDFAFEKLWLDTECFDCLEEDPNFIEFLKERKVGEAIEEGDEGEWLSWR